MQPRIVGIQRGARWLGEGWQLFRGAPFGWLAMVFAYWLLMTFASLLPFVGLVIAPVLVPAFSVGFMAAARAVGGGQRLQLAPLLAGVRSPAPGTPLPPGLASPPPPPPRLSPPTPPPHRRP